LPARPNLNYFLSISTGKNEETTHNLVLIVRSNFLFFFAKQLLLCNNYHLFHKYNRDHIINSK
jgi:hypothetical protein